MGTPTSSISSSTRHTLLDDFGGPEALQAVVNETIRRATKDRALEDFFRGVPPKFLKEHQFHFMKQRLMGILLKDESGSGSETGSESESDESSDEDSATSEDDDSSTEVEDSDSDDDEEDEEVRAKKRKEEKKFMDKIQKAHRRMFECGAHERHFDLFVAHWTAACQAVLFNSISKDISPPCPDSHTLKMANKVIFGPFRAVFERQGRKFRQKKKQLMDRLGGPEVLKHAVFRMLMHVKHDDLLGVIFSTLDMKLLEEHQYKFMEIAFTGCDSTLQDTMAFLEKRHSTVNKRFGLTGKHFDVMLLHFTYVLQELHIHDDVIHEVVHRMEPFRAVFDKKTLAFSWCTPTVLNTTTPATATAPAPEATTQRRADNVDVGKSTNIATSCEEGNKSEQARNKDISKYSRGIMSLGSLLHEEPMDPKLSNYLHTLVSTEEILSNMDNVDFTGKEDFQGLVVEAKSKKCPSTMTDAERKHGLIERFTTAAALVHSHAKQTVAGTSAKVIQPLPIPNFGKAFVSTMTPTLSKEMLLDINLANPIQVPKSTSSMSTRTEIISEVGTSLNSHSEPPLSIADATLSRSPRFSKCKPKHHTSRSTNTAIVSESIGSSSSDCSSSSKHTIATTSKTTETLSKPTAEARPLQKETVRGIQKAKSYVKDPKHHRHAHTTEKRKKGTHAKASRSARSGNSLAAHEKYISSNEGISPPRREKSVRSTSCSRAPQSMAPNQLVGTHTTEESRAKSAHIRSLHFRSTRHTDAVPEEKRTSSKHAKTIGCSVHSSNDAYIPRKSSKLSSTNSATSKTQKSERKSSKAKRESRKETSIAWSRSSGKGDLALLLTSSSPSKQVSRSPIRKGAGRRQFSSRKEPQRKETSCSKKMIAKSETESGVPRDVANGRANSSVRRSLSPEVTRLEDSAVALFYKDLVGGD